MLVRNYDSLPYLPTGVKCRATSVAKNSEPGKTDYLRNAENVDLTLHIASLCKNLKVKVDIAVSPSEPRLVKMGACLCNDQQEGDGGEGEQQGGDGDGGGGGGRQAHCVASSPAHPTLKTDRETSFGILTEDSSGTKKVYCHSPLKHVP